MSTSVDGDIGGLLIAPPPDVPAPTSAVAAPSVALSVPAWPTLTASPAAPPPLAGHWGAVVQVGN